MKTFVIKFNKNVLSILARSCRRKNMSLKQINNVVNVTNLNYSLSLLTKDFANENRIMS